MPINIPYIILISCCVSLDFIVGTTAYLTKIPFYFDSIGIMVCALLLPGSRKSAFFGAAIVAITSFTISGILINPFKPWYIITGIAGAAYGAFIVRSQGGGFRYKSDNRFQFFCMTILLGCGWGIVAAIVSAPITVYLFGGVTGSGTTLILAFFIKTGKQLLSAALLTGFSAEPVDKTLSLLCAIWVANSTPLSFRQFLRKK